MRLTYAQRSAVVRLLAANGGAVHVSVIAEVLGVPEEQARGLCEASGCSVKRNIVR